MTRAMYLLFDAPPMKLRPLLKKPLVLVGFFSLEAFTAGAGMWEGFATAVAKAAAAVGSKASLPAPSGLAGSGTAAASFTKWLLVASLGNGALLARFGGEFKLDGSRNLDLVTPASSDRDREECSTA